MTMQPTGYDSHSHVRLEVLVHPRPVPTKLREIHEEVRSTEWPRRVGLRRSSITLLDTLCRWQSLRGLAYIQALAFPIGSLDSLADIRIRPSHAGTRTEGLTPLLERLERQAKQVPGELLEIVTRDCTPLLENSPQSAFSVAAGLAMDSMPSPTEGVERAAALSAYWNFAPQLRPGLAMTHSVGSFIERWVEWADRYEENIASHSLGIGTHPAADQPDVEHLPAWMMDLVTDDPGHEKE